MYIFKYIKIYLFQLKKISNRKKINYYLIKILITFFLNLSIISYIAYYLSKYLCLDYYDSEFYKDLSIIRFILKEFGKDLCFNFLIVIYYSFEKKINTIKNNEEQIDNDTEYEIKIRKNSEDFDYDELALN